MSTLSSCHRCRGFVPPALTECVHCGASLRESAREGVALKGLLGLAGAGVAAITLMACYGTPPIPCDNPVPPPDGGTLGWTCADWGPPEEDGGVLGDGGMQGPDGGSDAGH